ncbi:cytochrome o ubiquinol oxidase, subunit III [Desulfovibrio sp. X2]|uniref:cytochrome o ubiquinol oxidase subunit III n=1 Tax=Desulfovibrio sp. X2 TaxID=941449 RepID=UPI000358F2F0|nr:cytochrome o ubiquinol oxidase subunit III [Desulfovibrio sp. X2]EPR41178.1 cytochrome o ubiquinol oxidase, subunit III [Desulfovibrio sp. X2]
MQTESLTMPADAQGEHGGHDVAEIQALGFWLYLMSDLIVFSSLFATYVVLGRNYAGGPTGKELFDLPGVLAETMLLLTSSVVYGLSMVAMQKGDRKKVLLGLAVTFLFGLGFVAMEVSEFRHMILIGAGPDRSGFLSAFFTLVGTHGLHVSFGLLGMVVMMVQTASKGLTGPVRSRLTRLGMFWHFLDIVWIGLFSIVYLMGAMQ